MIHPLAWLGWGGAVLVALSTTRNPWYLGLILLWIAVVSFTARPAMSTAPIPISPLRFGIFVVIVSALFNALTVHFGTTVLFRLPDILPLLGGVITVEAIIFGLLNGIVLAGIFAAFTVINRVLPVRAVVRLIPQAFYPVAVVVSIAVTFVPATLRQFQQIREAQAVRGHRLRGFRDWLPLFMPLLVGGMERALQLAEAMTSRGFASSDTSGQDPQTRIILIIGLMALLSGWLLRLVWGHALIGLGLMLGGIGTVSGVLWWVGRRIPRTVYRPDPWRSHDWGVVAGAALTAALFLFPLPGLDRSSIFYYPYPTLTLPSFNVAIGGATLGLLGPALFHRHSIVLARSVAWRPFLPKDAAKNDSF